MTVRLCWREPARAGDADWLSFEFENRTAATLQLAGFRYHLTSEPTTNLATGAPTGRRLSASGTHEELFDARGPIALPPGTTRVARRLRDDAFVALGDAGEDGIAVAATVAVAVAADDGPLGAPTTPGAGFEFTWRRPDEQGLERLRAQLDGFLREPEAAIVGRAGVAGALLETPGVGDRLTLERLLDARPRERRPFQVWPAVLRHLDAHHADDARLRKWLSKALAGDDPEVIADLLPMNRVWDDAWLRDVVRRFERGDERALWLLEWRGAPHAGDLELTRRLAAHYVARLRTRLLPARTTPNADELSMARYTVAQLRGIGSSRDRSRVDVVARWLACRAPLFVDRPIGYFAPGGEHHRVCDAALATILLLDDDARRHVEATVPSAGPFPVMGDADIERLDRLHDQRIVALQTWLAERPRAEERR